MPKNQNKTNKTIKETTWDLRRRKNGNRHGNFNPSLKPKSTSTENLSRANTQEKMILMIPEKFKHTKLGEIKSRKFRHTKLGETKITKNDFQT